MSNATRAILTQAAALLGVAIVVLGLWIWSAAQVWAVGAQRTDAADWSIRSFAIAVICLGQLTFALTVVPGLFARAGRSARGGLEQAYALAMALAALLAMVAGAALWAAAGW